MWKMVKIWWAYVKICEKYVNICEIWARTLDGSKKHIERPVTKTPNTKIEQQKLDGRSLDLSFFHFWWVVWIPCTPHSGWIVIIFLQKKDVKRQCGGNTVHVRSKFDISVKIAGKIWKVHRLLFSSIWWPEDRPVRSCIAGQNMAKHGENLPS